MNPKEIGLAIIGCGTIGRVRAALARDYPSIGWLGLCDTDRELGDKLKRPILPPTSPRRTSRELVARPEVTAAIVATDENAHAGADAGGGRARALSLHRKAARHRSRPQRAHPAGDRGAERGRGGRLHPAFPPPLHRGAAAYSRRADRRRHDRRDPRVHEPHGADRDAPPHERADRNLTPMVVSGTHTLDMSPVVGRRQDAGGGVCPLHGPRARRTRHQGCDASASSTMADGVHLEHEHQLGAAGGLARIGVRPGDRHRRHRRASSTSRTRTAMRCRLGAPAGRRVSAQGLRRRARRATSISSAATRQETWHDGQPLGPDARGDEDLVSTGSPWDMPTHHATAADGHRNLLLTMAMDLSARRGVPVKLPVRPEELLRAYDPASEPLDLGTFGPSDHQNPMLRPISPTPLHRLTETMATSLPRPGDRSARSDIAKRWRTVNVKMSARSRKSIFRRNGRFS